mgnify:CR=1 FL=1
MLFSKLKRPYGYDKIVHPLLLNLPFWIGAEAGFRAAEAAVLAHGGMGYAKEYDVERYFREAMIARIAPVSREMILNFIAEKVLGLPKSY